MDKSFLKSIGISYYKRYSGVLKRYRLVFNKIISKNSYFGYGNLTKDPNSEVEGIIYLINLKDLKNLDKYEPGYKRQKRIVLDKLGNRLNCHVYISKEIKEGLTPQKEYLKRFLAGKKFLSKEYYNSLVNYYRKLKT